VSVIATLLLVAAAPAARAETVGGFAYRVMISDRKKHVKSAPDGYAPTWKEHVETVVAGARRDAAFSELMKREVSRSRREFYSDEGCTSFESCADAGSVDIVEELAAASPDLVSVNIGTGFYRAGMPHPQYMSSRSFVWSRRFSRQLEERDIFARPPDRALRSLAQKRFDNRENMTNPNDPAGIPLDWTHASVGPHGITWSFEPYELGGYVAAGATTVSWAELKPYLRRPLPFTIRTLRAVSSSSRP
jgi:hypothetical protein